MFFLVWWYDLLSAYSLPPWELIKLFVAHLLSFLLFATFLAALRGRSILYCRIAGETRDCGVFRPGHNFDDMLVMLWSHPFSLSAILSRLFRYVNGFASVRGVRVFTVSVLTYQFCYDMVLAKLLASVGGLSACQIWTFKGSHMQGASRLVKFTPIDLNIAIDSSLNFYTFATG